MEKKCSNPNCLHWNKESSILRTPIVRGKAADRIFSGRY